MKDKNYTFTPHPLIPGGHLQTILGYYLPGANTLHKDKTHLVRTGDGDEIVLIENKPNRKSPTKKIIFLKHGLGGHAESSYMLRIAALFLNRGWIVFRMNHRGCGAGAGLARNLYHSGRSDDISLALNKISDIYPNYPIVSVGFSLSGNALLKLLGEQEDPVPNNLKGAIAVTPPIDLALCSGELIKLKNKIYDIRFVRMLRRDIKIRRSKFASFPEIQFPMLMNLRDFDEICTAPLNGFKSADDYYAKSSAKQFLKNIKHPTLLLASENDPFVPKETFENLPQNDFIEYLFTKSGGHMGFIAKDKTPLGDRRWMDYVILNFAERFMKKEL